MPVRETDLYPPVKAFLEAQGYSVKGEVSDCHVVGVRGGEEPVVVELKTAFTLQLVFQGIQRQTMTDGVYVAFGGRRRAGAPDVAAPRLRLVPAGGAGVSTP